MLQYAALIMLSVLMAASALAEVAIPEVDVKGGKDSPLVGRFAGSVLVSATQKDYDELTLPLSVLEQVKGQRDQHNNIVIEPKQKKILAGKRTRLVYLTPAGASPLEVVRNYQQELSGKGGTPLFECKGKECGGSPTRSSGGGGGEMSLAMYLWPAENIGDAELTTAHCAQAAGITEQRYAVMELPQNGAYFSILAYTIAAGSGSCKVLKDRTIAVVDILEVKDMHAKMVTVNAEEMAQEISQKGSVALYGIYFDSGKADVKPESQETLEQIAKLLTATPDFKLLVVGHTDNVGNFVSNTELSRRRAESVVNLLVAAYGIDKNRLTPVGVSFACPVASNTTEEGRAKNRRVELVGN
jgi:outer membrane protein OmpA-like peptidoglycan-associated protein